jgi:hypothetical protein
MFFHRSIEHFSRAREWVLFRLLFAHELGQLLDQDRRQVIQHPTLQKNLHVCGYIVANRMHQSLDVEMGGVGEYVTSIVDRKLFQNYCRTDGNHAE